MEIEWSLKKSIHLKCLKMQLKLCKIAYGQVGGGGGQTDQIYDIFFLYLHTSDI